MKVLVNGGVNLSGREGWWAEAYSPELGWVLGASGDGAVSDERDSEELYEILEKQVVPQFYDRDAGGIPRRWVGLMRGVMARLAPQFSSNRMLLDYLDRFYVPATRAFVRRQGQEVRLGRDLTAWSAAVSAHWHEVRFGEVDIRREGDQWRFHVHVYLGDVQLEWVRVELYAEAGGGLPAACIPMHGG